MKKIRPFFIFLFACLISAILPNSGKAVALAQEGLPGAPSHLEQRERDLTIRGLRVQGNQRVEAASILSCVNAKEGDVYTQKLADEIIKKVYATGTFERVDVRFEGGVLIVGVRERPVIVEVAFLNNKLLSGQEIEKEVGVGVGASYNPASVQTDVERIRSLYARNGYYSSVVTHRCENLPGNRVRLIFDIHEGSSSYVRRIRFSGNKVYPSGVLKAVISTKEWAPWRFLSDADKYRPDRMEYDKELLRQHYHAGGYIDFQILNASVQLAPDFEYFDILYSVEEGRQYRFGRIGVESHVRGLSETDLIGSVPTRSGEVYSPQKDQDAVDSLAYKAWLAGYPFVKITARVNKNEENATLDVTYVVERSTRLYIQRVNIVGNRRTIDSVIRRSLSFSDGDAFNQATLKQSFYNIRALDYFGSIRFDPVVLPSDGLIDLNVEVQEKPTGSLNFSLGYSTLDGIVAGISLSDRNVLGLGRSLGAGFRVTKDARYFSVSFDNPAFLGRRLSLGLGVDYQWMDLRSTSSYTVRTFGSTAQVGFPVSEHGMLMPSYRLSRQDIEDVGPDASMAIQQAEGISVRSIVGADYTYDRRDDPVDPKEGWDFNWRENLAGLGGTVRFLDSRAAVRFFRPVMSGIVGSARLSAAYLYGLGRNTNVNDRYFMGGELFPGFDRSGVGPRDLATGDALGSQAYLTAVFNVRVPNGLSQSLGVETDVFTQLGFVGLADAAPPTAAVNMAYRQTVGVSLQFKHILGVKFVFAVPVIKEKYDRTLPFLLTASRDF